MKKLLSSLSLSSLPLVPALIAGFVVITLAALELASCSNDLEGPDFGDLPAGAGQTQSSVQPQSIIRNSNYPPVSTAETIDMSALNAPCEGNYWKYNGNSLSILDGGFVLLSGQAACPVETAEGVHATLILHDLTVNTLNLWGEVTLLLAGTNTLNNELGNFTTLTIDSALETGSTSGTLYLGRVDLTGGKSLSIEGGTIFAYQVPVMMDPPAIGASGWSDFGTLRISGGAVVAGGSMPVIGGGSWTSAGGLIDISGGTLILDGPTGSIYFRNGDSTANTINIHGNPVIFARSISGYDGTNHHDGILLLDKSEFTMTNSGEGDNPDKSGSITLSECANFAPPDGWAFEVPGWTITIPVLDENYWYDGNYLLLNTHTIGAGVPIVLVGEGFNHEELRKGGYWEQIATILGNQFLNLQTVRDLRDYYDVYILMSESPLSNTGVANNGNLGKGKSRFEREGWGLVENSISTHLPLGDRQSLRRIIYVCNGAIGGWARGDDLAAFSTETDWPQVPGTVNTADLTQAPGTVWMMHEFGGHAFGSLADEYHFEYVQPGDWGHWDFGGINMHSTDGNSSVWATDNPAHAAPWAPFIGLENYEMVGYFGSGGNILCEPASIMSGPSDRYNAISRYAIWAGTMVKAGIHPISYYLDTVTYDGGKRNVFPTPQALAEFIAFDAVNYDNTRTPLTGTVTVNVDSTVLTADASGLSTSGSEPVIYTWQRSNSPSGPWTSIVGAAGLLKDPVITDDGNVYYVQAEDAGKYLRVRTSRYSLRGYIDSEVVGPVPYYPALNGSAAIVGTPAVGNTVEAALLESYNSEFPVNLGFIFAWHRGFTSDPQTFFVAQKKTGDKYECETGSTLTLKDTGGNWPTNDQGRYLRVLVRQKGYTGYAKSDIVAIP